MALEKVISYEQMVYHPSSVHVREKTAIMEEGKEISFSYQRWVIMCDEDYSEFDGFNEEQPIRLREVMEDDINLLSSFKEYTPNILL